MESSFSSTSWAQDFVCPPELVPDAREALAGAYDLPGADFGTPPVVLDVGANVGAFMRWAERRWPGATLHCYEPHPVVAPFLRRNAAGRPAVHVHEAAVSDVDGTATLHEGRESACWATLSADLAREHGSGVTFDVACVDARGLPECDVMKVDTEGSELPILARYLTSHALPPALVMVEFHRPRDRRAIEDLLEPFGLDLVRGEIPLPYRGVLWFLHREGARRKRRA